MTTNNGTQPEQVETIHDDGFDSPDDRAAFDQMQRDDAAAGGEPQTEPAKPDADTAAAAAAPGGDDDGDEGDDDAAGDGAAAAAAKPGEVVDPAAQRPPRRVPYKRFKAAEDERNSLRSENQKFRETQARLDERFRLLNEALTTPKAEEKPVDEDPEPDPEADLFGHNAWLKRQLVKTTSRLDQMERGGQERQQAQTADQELATTYMDSAKAFAQNEPNFLPAYSYLMQVRTVQIAALDYDKDLFAGDKLTTQEIAQIQAKVAREEKQIVAAALKKGKDPAADIFRLARVSGYRPAAAAAGGANGQNGAAHDHAGGAAKPANGAAKPAAASSTVQDEIARIQAGQAASESLSNGGGSPANAMTAEKLANMPQAEFEAWAESHSESELRALMGG